MPTSDPRSSANNTTRITQLFPAASEDGHKLNGVKSSRSAPAPAVIEAGLSETVTPAGAPDAERLIVLADPAMTAVEIVDAPELPCTTVTEVGETEIEKSGQGI